MIDEEVVKTVTKVIIQAGNARALIQEALVEADSGRPERAGELLGKADEEIKKAHVAQTEMIEAEVSGGNPPLSLLVTHAQDTLMVTMSERGMADRLIGIYGRLAALARTEPAGRKDGE